MTLSTAETILNLLVTHENDWLSGQELASQLNLSRAAIWKAIAKLTADGFTIERQRGPGKGYRYVPDEKMSVVGIQRDLKHPIAVQVFDCLPSTNTYAKQHLISGDITEPTVIIANIQTRGVGHFGQAFDSPAQTGLYLSFALPIEAQEKVIPTLLTEAVAVAVARTVKNLFQIDLDFKWLNNLYYHHQKVGGILTEALINFETGTYSALVIGIGLNLTNRQTALGFITDQLNISRNQIAAQLIDQLATVYRTYQDGHYLAEYRRHLLDIGHTVTIQYHQKVISGLAESIDDQGRLVLQTSDGYHKLTSGDRI